VIAIETFAFPLTERDPDLLYGTSVDGAKRE
jgi:hypothetical protein